MSIKANNHLWQRNKDLVFTKQILRHIEESPLACIIPVLSSTELIKKPFTWWEQYACAGKFREISYYYVIEFLGNDPCVLINQKERVAEYYRITLLALPGTSKGARLFLQSTLAKASSEKILCRRGLHQIAMGRQMLREI